MTNPIIEKAARAAFEGFGGAAVASGKSWEQQTEHFRECFRLEVRAVLGALKYEDGTDEDRFLAISGKYQVEIISLTEAWDALIDTALGETGE